MLEVHSTPGKPAERCGGDGNKCTSVGPEWAPREKPPPLPLLTVCQYPAPPNGEQEAKETLPLFTPYSVGVYVEVGT